TFVGRHAELRRLHEQVALGQVGVVTALHGLGGLGKTELAVAYAHAFADQYRGGAWSLAAEGKSDLLALIGELSVVPELDYTRTTAEENDPHLAGRAVLAYLTKMATTAAGPDDDGTGAHALLILDNVDDPGLLSARQLAVLPAGDAVRVAATTRLGADQLAARAALAFVPVDALAPDDAVELIRWHQPPRDSEGRYPDFVSREEESAAREIVELLAGFTLAVEQVAVFLGLNPDVAPSKYLAWLRTEGLSLADRHATDSVQDAMLHEEGLLSVVLASQLGTVDEVGRFVLRTAACLPPEEIPWPWLETIARAGFPHLNASASGPDPWLAVRRRVEGLRFLTPGEHPAAARMHRMVATHLRAADDGAVEAAVAGHVAARARALKRGEPAGTWEWAAVSHAALPLVRAHPETIPDIGNAVSRIASYVVDGSVEQLADRLLAHHRDLAAAQPGSLEAARDVSVSLDNVARLRRAGDPAGALTLYEESLTLLRDLAAAQPGSIQAQSDLIVSLSQLASLLDEAEARSPSAGAPAETAAKYWKKACALMQSLDARGHLPPSWDRLLRIACEKAAQ
ncbi:MAG TPA: hypothetical protein VFC82_01050, partial [Actinomycetaceae bacterium]|nr:hypothetical protein [Actinomycetaceae bacterium]